jgi:hypothetical protein
VGGVDGGEHSLAKGSRREVIEDNGLCGFSHLKGESLVVEEAESKSVEFRRIVGKKAADAMLNGRSRMPVADDWEAGGHGFESGGIVSILEKWVRGMNKETVALENLFEIVPIARGLDAGKFRIVADESDGNSGESSPVKIPKEGSRAAENKTGDAKALREIAMPRKIVGGIHGERYDVILEAPGAAL